MDGFDEALALNTRDKIYKIINRNPGLHFREIQRRTSIATGSLQYHLSFLEKKHLVRTAREGKFLRYYSVRGEQLGEAEPLMALLRQESVRRIVLFLLTKKKGANNFKIAQAIGLSPSTTSWHLDKLLKANVIERKRRGRKSFFYLTNPLQVAELLVGHRKSFLDEVVDNFVELWTEFE